MDLQSLNISSAESNDFAVLALDNTGLNITNISEIQSFDFANKSSSNYTTLTITNKQIITLILPYTVIFLSAIIGNALVIITLGANRRMRSVTNVFLFNLAVSDLLLGVFCMPFTLVGTLLREFIFGEMMCRLVPYLQAVSVSVSAWTLVVMSVERYYAICHPFKSLESRQTLSHAYKMIALVWISSLIFMSPIGIVSELQPIRGTDKLKCRESWPQAYFEVFTIFLDFVLLIIPLIIMILTYTLIAITLWKNMKNNINSQEQNETNLKRERKNSKNNCNERNNCRDNSVNSVHRNGETTIVTKYLNERPRVTQLRSSTNPAHCEARQRRVIKMLFAVVIEFFVCWTPLYTINTITLYDPKSVYIGLGYNWLSFFQLLAFFSSCTNPITYCFMNSRFRQSFISLFACKANRSISENYASTAVSGHMSSRFNHRYSAHKQNKTRNSLIAEPNVVTHEL